MKYAVMMHCVRPDGLDRTFNTDKAGTLYTEGTHQSRVTGAGDTFLISVLVEADSLILATVLGAININRITAANELPRWPAKRLDVVEHYDKVGP